MSVKFALLGAGRIGKVHAKAVTSNPDAQLVAVTDAMADAANAVAQQYGARVASLDEIAAASDIDAVIICTPTDTHADLIQKYSDAGKAVFCEKPIDLDVDRVKACLQTVEANGTALMVGFNRRFDPSFAALKAEIEAGTIGDVEQVVITSRDPGLPPYDYIPVSGGIFRDMTIHDFDMARFLLGEEIETVMATGSCLVDPKVKELGDFDTAAAILTTASGKQAIINNSRRATYGYDQRVEVHGSKGSVSAQNERPVNIEVATSAGYTAPPLHDFFMTRYVAAYAAEIAEFIDVVKNSKAPSPSGADGLAALAIAEAAEASVATGASVKTNE